MSDPKRELQGLFVESSRFTNFGDIIARMHVQGFRCHGNTVIDVHSPITAICGLNGTGKTTLLQLAAVAYKGTAASRRYYVKNFLITGTLDPNPVQTGARVTYEYLQDSTNPESARNKTVTITRAAVNWTGFTRQPQRHVLYAGVGAYLPRVEELDSVTYYARHIRVHQSHPLATDLRTAIARVLSATYVDAIENLVTAHRVSQKLISVGRNGSSYSEINMGFGEARVYRLLRDLDALPGRSLILLEEPEISLHPSAQHELGRYLVDLCIRKRHQIFLTTHSEHLLNALPEQSRLYLHKTTTGISVIPGLSVGEAASLLTGQHRAALHILVEDDVADHIVTELLRKHDPVFLKTVRITRVGSKQDIQTVIKALNDMGVPACAVRDADTGANPRQNLFKLFGSLPPEKEIFQAATFRALIQTKFGLNVDEIELQFVGRDHHEWFAELARVIPYNHDALLQLSAEAYLASIRETERNTLVQQLKAVLQ